MLDCILSVYVCRTYSGFLTLAKNLGHRDVALYCESEIAYGTILYTTTHPGTMLIQGIIVLIPQVSQLFDLLNYEGSTCRK